MAPYTPQPARLWYSRAVGQREPVVPEKFLAYLREEEDVRRRKELVLRIGVFTVCFAVLQPHEAWHSPLLGGTLAVMVGAVIAQGILYRGWFDRATQWLLTRPERDGTLTYAGTLFLFVLAVVLSTRGLYELVCRLVTR